MSVAFQPAWTPRRRRALVRALLCWFAARARDLPWRRTRDPYAIWVAEVMLQQTRVATVLPYWERWMRHLPDVAAVARARPERLRRLWEGLGYYRRVRNLQAAARLLMRQYGGRFPDQFEQVLALPGVGRYTAGAICSAAFNQPTPVVDGNVARVLTRLLGRRLGATDPAAWATARLLVECAANFPAVRLRAVAPAADGASPPSCPPCSALNQALMELGATICTPQQPRCTECPIRKFCVFRKNPVGLGKRRSPRPPLEERHLRVWLVQRGRRWLVRLRGLKEVNGGYWELPTFEVPAPDARPAVRSPAASPEPFQALASAPLLRLTHHITRYRYRVEVFAGKLCRPWPAGRWLTRQQLWARPLTRLSRKILQHLGGTEERPGIASAHPNP